MGWNGFPSWVSNAGSIQPSILTAMLHTLKDLFNAMTAAAHSPKPEAREHAVQLATSVLLVEVMRADPEIHPAERTILAAALRHQFALTDPELNQLVAQAEHTAQSAYDYHRFTTSINEHFSHAHKVNMIEAMWQVAYADGHLDAHENHLISKIASLLHVTHGEYIGAKMRAKEAAQP
ncbi:MAG: hypothetical protein RL710_1832 [Pseudomonadota bacterium]|jgi:uncharacterized tellurite resistance protein B-like protein